MDSGSRRTHTFRRADAALIQSPTRSTPPCSPRQAAPRVTETARNRGNLRRSNLASSICSSCRLELNIVSNHRGNPEGRLQEPCQPDAADHAIWPLIESVVAFKATTTSSTAASVVRETSHADCGPASGVEEWRVPRAPRRPLPLVRVRPPYPGVAVRGCFRTRSRRAFVLAVITDIGVGFVAPVPAVWEPPADHGRFEPRLVTHLA